MVKLPFYLAKCYSLLTTMIESKPHTRYTKEEYDYVHELRRLGFSYYEIERWSGVNRATARLWVLRKYKPWRMSIHVPWNKGLTKEVDERVMAYSLKLRGRVVSEETRAKIGTSEMGNHKAKGGKSNRGQHWQAGSDGRHIYH